MVHGFVFCFVLSHRMWIFHSSIQHSFPPLRHTKVPHKLKLRGSYPWWHVLRPPLHCKMLTLCLFLSHPAVLLCSLYLWAGPKVPEYCLHYGVFPGMCPEDHRFWLLGMSLNLSQHWKYLFFFWVHSQPLLEGGSYCHSWNGSHTCPIIERSFWLLNKLP